jgi:hypothetical protein
MDSGHNSRQINRFSQNHQNRNSKITLPFFIAGFLLGTIVPAFREPAIWFLIKQIEILQRKLAELGIATVTGPAESKPGLLNFSHTHGTTRAEREAT